jgi:hypothetical protein
MSTDFALAVAVGVENPVAHDIQLTDSQITLLPNTDAVLQHIRVRLQFFLGEWFLDRREGIPFYRDIFIKNPSRDLITAIFRQAILDTPGVEVISSFDLVFSSIDRTMDLAFVAQLESGEVLSVDFGDFIVEVL